MLKKSNDSSAPLIMEVARIFLDFKHYFLLEYSIVRFKIT